MENFISKLNPNQLVVALYHQKLFNLYQKFSGMIDKKILPKFDVNTRKLYEHLSDLESGLTSEGFRLKCQSLGFSEDMVNYLSSEFSRYCGLEDDDYKSLFYLIRNYILNEAIKDAVEKYNSNHEVDAFIDVISSYKVTDLNNNFNDEKLFTSSTFGEIDVEQVEDEFVQGVIKSSLKIVNDATSLHGYLRGTMTVFAAPTKTGKSMISMQETIEFLKQDLNVLYAAFGDLKKYDMLYRISSMINHRPMPFTEMNLKTEVNLARSKVPQLKDHLYIQLLAPDKFSASDYVEYVKNTYTKDGKTKLHDWADVIIIDYDANIQSENSMYLKGEDIYQKLYQLTYPDKLVIVLAQTNKYSWGKEIIGLGELGESSRKQQIIDLLITLSHPVCYNVQNNVGWMNLCAGRRCMLMKTPYMRDIDGTFHTISSDTYGLIKASSEPKTFIEDIDKYSNYISGNYTTINSSLDTPEYSGNESDEDTDVGKDEES